LAIYFLLFVGVITNLLFVGVITNKAMDCARDSSGILFLQSQSSAKKDIAHGPTLSFFLLCLNILNKFIKMKGLRPNSGTRFHSHTVIGLRPNSRSRFHSLSHAVLFALALIFPLRSNLPDRPAAFYFHVITCYVAGGITQQIN
jgi:hypothetical protein